MAKPSFGSSTSIYQLFDQCEQKLTTTAAPGCLQHETVHRQTSPTETVSISPVLCVITVLTLCLG